MDPLGQSGEIAVLGAGDDARMLGFRLPVQPEEILAEILSSGAA
jgi:hypothetical protein